MMNCRNTSRQRYLGLFAKPTNEVNGKRPGRCLCSLNAPPGRDEVRQAMCLMRSIGADWAPDATQSLDYKTRSKNMKNASHDFPKRCVQPSTTQLFLIRWDCPIHAPI